MDVAKQRVVQKTSKSLLVSSCGEVEHHEGRHLVSQTPVLPVHRPAVHAGFPHVFGQASAAREDLHERSATSWLQQQPITSE